MFFFYNISRNIGVLVDSNSLKSLPRSSIISHRQRSYF